MTETKETTEKTLRGDAPRKPLSLKRTVESGHVRQNFSHGRSKSVVVEKKKKRTIAGPGGAEGAEGAAQAEADRLLAEVMQKPGGLSTDELDARRRGHAEQCRCHDCAAVLWGRTGHGWHCLGWGRHGVGAR